jgi:hypothetical protein
MGVYEGRAQIVKSAKDLMGQWLDARNNWNDAMSEQIEKDCLVPLEMDVRNAAGAMEHMAQILHQIKSECK